ncbi:MAG: 5'/3'-nucleotidase SurE [Thermodesulfovibrionia bacterium]|nr:5'/3'-nucleotidase SurE [Thermodesulfovibrionia bacterium]
MPLILVTNDDGISSAGIKALAKALEAAGDVYIVAPDSEQSAVAHALTLHRPLKSAKTGKKKFSINGTPTDCVIIGVNKLLPRKPDILVSGINHGGNLGDDVTYSGTVAAAMEATLLGIPSIAISLAIDPQSNGDLNIKPSRFRQAADIAVKFAGIVLKKGLPKDTLLNINVPDLLKIKGEKFTKQGKRVYDSSIQELSDPRGKKHYWIGGGMPIWEPGEETDFEAVINGFVSVTPVHLDMTNYRALKFIKKNWKV